MIKCEINEKILSSLKEIITYDITPQIKHDPDLHIEIGPFPGKQLWNSRGIPIIKLSMGQNVTIDYIAGEGFTTSDMWKVSSAQKIIEYINDTWIKDRKAEISIIKKRKNDIETLHQAMEEMKALHYHPNELPGLIKNLMQRSLGLPKNISDKLVHYYIIADEWSRDQIINNPRKPSYWNFSNSFADEDQSKFKMLVVVVREDENKFKLRAVYPTKVYNNASYGIYDNKWYVAKNIMRHLGKFAGIHPTIASLIANPGD